uniref:Vitamin K-dependent gamma-carboxylase n=1 Tax=Phallusia mammillata TaxID=59560 RepID=A0A6F9DCV5_9ASCI|nr:vitamin K-dependent gamma-carboxylase [Phallusia mammillata]
MTQMKELFGFNPRELLSWKSLVILLNKPRDASILAYARIAYGILMMIDIPQERGMVHVDARYGEGTEDLCRFPYIHSLKPLSYDYMAALYAVLFLCACGIALGFMYRISCFCFALVYWYFFMLDKSVWNNHSYLYGLLSILFLLTDGHRYMSVDGYFRKSIQNTHVPLWNYTLLRFQIFLVYFYAGLKKTESDWLLGYSMQRLSAHWVFDPIRLVLSDSTMDYVIVHLGGFILDFSVGFILFFDKTRWLGFLMCGSFHCMNSQLFRIGMFPYAMLATMFVFCHCDTFKQFLNSFNICGNIFDTASAKQNPSCIYEPKKGEQIKTRWKHVLVTFLTLSYISEQLFLPYSHFITKGYNGWTQGPYGYSWDMMVHSFANQHIKVMYKDSSGKEGFLKPGVFVLSAKKSRWSVHPDMAIQYARCVRERLIDLGIDKPEIYFDVWKSMNGRFQQRVFDPSVELAGYDWSPFKKPKFVLPVLSELSDWRTKLRSLKQEYRNQTIDVVFVADFPGMSLNNFVQEDFGNASLEVLQGEVSVKFDAQAGDEVTLKAGEKIRVPAGEFHTVLTTSKTPSCYFYTYENTTAAALNEKVKDLRKKVNSAESPAIPWISPQGNDDDAADEMVVDEFQRQEMERTKRKEETQRSFGEKAALFALKKIGVFRRSYLLAVYSIRNIVFGRPDIRQLANEMEYIDSWNANIRKSWGRGKEDSVEASNQKTEL